jgi:hypothetical protein
MGALRWALPERELGLGPKHAPGDLRELVLLKGGLLEYGNSWARFPNTIPESFLRLLGILKEAGSPTSCPLACPRAGLSHTPELSSAQPSNTMIVFSETKLLGSK